MNYLERYEFWRNAGLPQEVQAELSAIRGDEEELKGRFGSDLQFGTAGMRGTPRLTASRRLFPRS